MHNASGALIALLNGQQELFIADVLTIIPLVGASLYLTSAGVDVAVESQVDSAVHTFKAGGYDGDGVIRPSFKAGATKVTIGTEVDALQLSLMCNVLALLDAAPWTQQAAAGYFDGAFVCLERTLTSTWGDWSAGTLIRFWGRVGKVAPTRNTIAMTINSDMVLLSRPMPRNLYQPGCLHNVYDAGCMLVKATFAVSSTAAIGSTASSINTALAQADGYFELGGITFTSGANDGVTRTVKTYLNAGGVVTPTRPFPFAPANGDTFDIFPGCDKAQATCSGKFANLSHFRGFPYVPSPESGS
jgi:uncharacterized phage protein (TIGR02218 family)